MIHFMNELGRKPRISQIVSSDHTPTSKWLASGHSTHSTPSRFLLKKYGIAYHMYRWTKWIIIKCDVIVTSPPDKLHRPGKNIIPSIFRNWVDLFRKQKEKFGSWWKRNDRGWWSMSYKSIPPWSRRQAVWYARYLDASFKPLNRARWRRNGQWYR